MPKTGRGSILHKFMGKQMLKKKKTKQPSPLNEEYAANGIDEAIQCFMERENA